MEAHGYQEGKDISVNKTRERNRPAYVAWTSIQTHLFVSTTPAVQKEAVFSMTWTHISSRIWQRRKIYGK